MKTQDTTQVPGVKTTEEVDVLMQTVKAMQEQLEQLKKDKINPNSFIREDKSTNSKLKSCLIPGKTVRITPIKKGANSLIKDPDEATMLRGSGRSLTVPIRKSGVLVDPLNNEEREYLEDVLGVDLNIYSKDCFFKTRAAQLKFKKTGRTIKSAEVKLNLGDAFDYLLWKIALTSQRVAKTWSDRNNPICEFVIIDDSQVLAEKTSKSDKEDLVLSYLLSNKTNRKALYDLLRLYGSATNIRKSVTKNHSVEWMYTELKAIKDSTSGLNDLYNVISKLTSSKEKMARMVLVMDSLESGAIEKVSNEFKRKGTTIGQSIEDVIMFLNNKENSVTSLSITKEVDEYLKTTE